MRKLFDTPLKATISSFCIAAIVLSIIAVIGAFLMRSMLISRDKAGEIALNDAGLAASEIASIRTDLEFDDGRFQYEVEFFHKGTEYDYVIHARSGNILERDIDHGANEFAANTKH